jgi:hypothetical protein
MFTLALFLWIPLRAEYLIPVLPAAAVLFIAFNDRKAMMLLAVLEAVSWFVVISPLTIQHRSGELLCDPMVTSGATFNLHLSEGIFLGPLLGREVNTPCNMRVLRLRPSDLPRPLPLSVFLRGHRSRRSRTGS